MQIGEVADRTGLSLRSIRYYEEVGLAIPSARSAGGFRIYTEADLYRLRLIMRMKPLGYSLEAMREVFEVLDALEAREGDREELQERLRDLHTAARDRVSELREKLSMAEEFADGLGARLER